MNIREFQQTILDWYKTHNRDWLPWRPSASSRRVDPYHILVSEIMLQQTQVSRVLEKYPEFLQAFPSIDALANAPLADVLTVWQGMGYNRRARYLKEAAVDIVTRYQGEIPRDPKELLTLSGIGAYSAGAIACFAFNEPTVFLDTNIRKVFIQFFFASNNKVSDAQIREVVRKTLYKRNPRQWYWALMDYGATALSDRNELLVKVASYRKQLPFEGSFRYFRSKIVRHLLKTKQASRDEIQRLVTGDPDFSPSINIEKLLAELQKDRLIVKSPHHWYYIYT